MSRKQTNDNCTPPAGGPWVALKTFWSYKMWYDFDTDEEVRASPRSWTYNDHSETHITFNGPAYSGRRIFLTVVLDTPQNTHGKIERADWQNEDGEWVEKNYT